MKQYFKIDAGVRYWEDASVNGVADDKGELIPFRNGDRWQPIIDITTGVVINWPAGTVADIHYKVCDDGNYYICDSNMLPLMQIESFYVPDMACPEPHGFGDYIIMHIDGTGKVQNFKYSEKGFHEEED